MMNRPPSQLGYLPGDRFYPNHEPQTVVAEPFIQVADEPLTHLEGLCFDRNGDLYFVEIYQGLIMKLDMKSLKLIEIHKDENLRPAAVKIHKDGRLFVCCIERHGRLGALVTMNPDGSDVQYILRGMSIDDMVFDSEGGFYYTHFAGDACAPSGGVYYISPDMQSIEPICTNLAGPNGVALSADEEFLWITETWGGRLIRVEVATKSSNVLYYFNGALGPDSCSIDEDDNLYVAMAGQGCVMVFNRYGHLIGRVLMPDRERGYNPGVTHALVRPGTKDLYISVFDDVVGKNAWIFRAGSYAAGHGKAYQFG
jgi:lactonase